MKRRGVVGAVAVLGLLALVPGEVRSEHRFRYLLSSGPFNVPQGAHSIDWVVINNSRHAQEVRVTVYEYLIGTPRTVTPPGPLTVTVDSASATHNANTVGIVFRAGAIYEVQVETNSLRVLPMVTAWPAASPPDIPGALIPSGAWVRLR
jgi:hypothetical protein